MKLCQIAFSRKGILRSCLALSLGLAAPGMRAAQASKGTEPAFSIIQNADVLDMPLDVALVAGSVAIAEERDSPAWHELGHQGPISLKSLKTYRLRFVPANGHLEAWLKFGSGEGLTAMHVVRDAGSPSDPQTFEFHCKNFGYSHLDINFPAFEHPRAGRFVQIVHVNP